MKITRRTIKASTASRRSNVTAAYDKTRQKLQDACEGFIGRKADDVLDELDSMGFSDHSSSPVREDGEVVGRREVFWSSSYDTDIVIEYDKQTEEVYNAYTEETKDNQAGVGAATETAKRPIKASRSIMAGAGSGITLELADLDFTEVPDGGFYNEYNDMHDFLEPENGWCKGTIQIKSIGTYYEGGDPGLGDIPVSIQVAEVIPDDADDAQALIGDSLKSVVDDIYEIEDKVLIGGGYTRSTFTGEFETEAFTSDATLKLKVKIEDNGIAEWLDKFAHGESEEIYFDICINGDPQGTYFESQEDAIATAQEYAADPQYADDEITVMMEHYSTNYEGEIMDYFDDAGDIVWSSNDALYE